MAQRDGVAPAYERFRNRHPRQAVQWVYGNPVEFLTSTAKLPGAGSEQSTGEYEARSGPAITTAAGEKKM